MSSDSLKLSFEDYVKGIKKMEPEEQLNLIEIITAMVKKETIKKKHSILELEGLGAEIWQGIDAQKYVNKERDSWD